MSSFEAITEDDRVLLDSPQQLTLRLGSRERVEETVQRIQSRLAAASRKV